MNILVTGGLGFIGSNFIKYWLKKYPEDTIINLDKNTDAGDPANVEEHDNYVWVDGDICDTLLVDYICKNSDIELIVHFAGETHVDTSIAGAEPFIQTNVIGTHSLVKVATKYGIRFHHVSTDEVFGSLALDSTDRFSESSPYDPRNPYSASKASSDHLVRAYHHTHGLAVTISNCSNNYGPNQDTTKLIPKAITAFLKDELMGIYGDGENVRDWLYVQDHVEGIEKVIKEGKIGETYLFGGEEVSNLAMMGMLMNIIGKGGLKFIEDRKGHDRRYAVDITKAYTELNWRPKTSLEDGLKKTVSHYERKL